MSNKFEEQIVDIRIVGVRPKSYLIYLFILFSIFVIIYFYLVFAKFILMMKMRLVVDIKVVQVVLEARMLIGRILIRFENLKNQFKLELNQNQKQIQFLNLRKSQVVLEARPPGPDEYLKFMVLVCLKKNQKNHPFRQKE